MSKVIVRWLSLLSLLMVSAGAKAQSLRLPDEVSWPELARILQTRSPRDAVREADLEQARTQIGLSERIPNPALSYMFYGRARGNSQAINATQHQLQVEQALPMWGQRNARKHAARVAVDAARAVVELARVDLRTQAQLAFIALLIQQERVARLQAAVARMDELCTLISGRVKAGLFSQYDLTRAELEQTRIASELDSARADVSGFQGQLAALVGAPDWTPRAVGELVAPPVWEAELTDLSDAPANRAADAQTRASQSQLDLADRERLPALSVTAGVYLTTDGSSTSGLLGIAMPVPLFDHGKASLAQARAQHESARRVSTAVALETRAAAVSAMRELTLRRRAYAPFAQGIPERLATLRDMADASYRAGQVSVLVLLDAVRAQVDVELESLERLAQLSASDVHARALALAGQIATD